MVEVSIQKFKGLGRESCKDIQVPDKRSIRVDGRSKPRTQKQMESYRYNFSKRDFLAKKVEELDSRLGSLQRVVLSIHGKYSD